MSSSCCAGNCGCGSGCKCGTSCGGCKMYPDVSYAEAISAVAQTVVLGVAPLKASMESEAGLAENGGCKCGDKCTCDPCNCK